MRALTLGLLIASIGSASHAEMPMRPYLSLDAAQAGTQACLDWAAGEDLRVAVAVMDRGGRLVSFARMDDVFVKQVEFAQIKAETASTTPASTKRIGEIAVPGSPVEGLVYLSGVTGVEGGVPIRVGEHAIGGIGVSGATPAQDGTCAAIAVDAVIEALGR